jgi:hypothetical protein
MPVGILTSVREPRGHVALFLCSSTRNGM